ncbi:MAG: hypothetical protein RI885_142 [Actinomycetota bacterium]|jgi:bacteriocin biosynthesis cyclodehydratase domain-containing protein
MVLRLDPRYPVLWRSPFSLQLGADDPPVVLGDVSPGAERMLAALAVGVSRPGLDVIAKSSGEAVSSAGTLLDAVRPALLPRRDERQPTVTVMGRGRTVELLAESLAAEGVSVSLCGRDLERAVLPADLAIVVAHFVIEPELHGLWLRRDVPHLPVVLGDRSVRIGPVVEPGLGPCLYCLEHSRTEQHPWWPAVEAQLWGRESPIDRGATAAQGAAIAARLALTRLAGSARPGRSARPRPATSIVLDAASGVTTERGHSPHPDCGCSALPGSGIAPAGPTAAAAPKPTTVAVGAVPA